MKVSPVGLHKYYIVHITCLTAQFHCMHIVGYECPVQLSLPSKTKQNNTLQIHRRFPTRLKTNSTNLKMRCAFPVTTLKLLKTNKTQQSKKMN